MNSNESVIRNLGAGRPPFNRGTRVQAPASVRLRSVSVLEDPSATGLLTPCSEFRQKETNKKGRSRGKKNQ